MLLLCSQALGIRSNTTKISILLRFEPGIHHIMYFIKIALFLQATAWIGTTILVVLALLHVVMVCGYFRKLRRPQDPPPYEPLHTEEDTDHTPAAV